MKNWLFVLVVLTVVSCSSLVKAEFEEQRCKCLCPDQSAMDDYPNPSPKDRYYVNTSVTADACGPPAVVKPVLINRITASGNDTEKLRAEIDKFILRCTCKYETRNVTMIKVVVIFVIAVISCLFAYMIFLFCLDTKWKHQHRSQQRGYEEHIDEPDENIFAAPTVTPSAESVTNRDTDNGEIRARNTTQTSGVLGRVEAEQSRWLRSVEQQRRSIFTDHTMLN